jgi:GlpG protein
MMTKKKKPSKFFNAITWRITYNSPVTLSFILICVGVMLLETLLPGQIVLPAFSCFGSDFSNPMQYFRLFSHCLGHYSWDHLLSNLMLILLVGPIVEEKHGSLRLLLLIVITAGITGLTSVLMTPDAYLMGASGVALMLVLLASCVNFSAKTIPLTMILVLLCYQGKDIIALFGPQDDGIAHVAHIIGAVVGALFGLLDGASKNPFPPPLANSAKPPDFGHSRLDDIEIIPSTARSSKKHK